jgi:hypothetical protein
MELESLVLSPPKCTGMCIQTFLYEEPRREIGFEKGLLLGKQTWILAGSII